MTRGEGAGAAQRCVTCFVTAADAVGHMHTAESLASLQLCERSAPVMVRLCWCVPLICRPVLCPPLPCRLVGGLVLRELLRAAPEVRTAAAADPGPALPSASLDLLP